MLDLTRYKFLTFDCYGTLIDWESGILASLRSLLAARDMVLSDNEILEDYAVFESDEEHGGYQPYAEVLRKIVAHFGHKYGFDCDAAERETLAASFHEWKPFPDTIAALQMLSRHYSLNIISNVDDELFAITAQYLPVRFDNVITAQQVGSYKPSFQNFESALARLDVLPQQVLHVAQSIYHDIVPAKELEIATVWVNRRGAKPGCGATRPAEAIPNLEVPDLKTLARQVEEAFA